MRKRGRQFKKEINKLTFGLFDTLIDVSLFSFYLWTQSYRIKTGKTGPIQAVSKAINAVKATHVNSFKRAIYQATTKGYLERKEDYLKITKLGIDRLKRTMPLYEEKRPWDGKLYLVTYDIPEEKKYLRDYLRNRLRQLGCGMLQQSVWLTPYNPKTIIADFVKKHRLVGLVLVSELKEGSGIGGKDVQAVVEKVYELNGINNEYEDFIHEIDEGKIKGIELVIKYLSILKKDPQLPFELLPEYWSGDHAYEFAKKELRLLKKRAFNEEDSQIIFLSATRPRA